MSYMDRLAGTTRTRTPIVPAGRVSSLHDARNLAAARERTDDDSASFREMRSLMRQNTGPCG